MEGAGTPQAGGGAPGAAGAKTAAGGKYVPPSMRDGANKGRGESMMSKRGGKQLEIE